jgi:hypothetical protein
MDVPVEEHQRMLEDAYETSQAAQTVGGLRGQLRIWEQNIARQYEVTGSIASIAKNSASQSYRGSAVGSYTPAQLSQSFRRLINLFDSVQREVQSALAGLQPTTPPPWWPKDATDSSIYPIMKWQLAEMLPSEYECDFTFLRLHPTLAGPYPATW